MFTNDMECNCIFSAAEVVPAQAFVSNKKKREIVIGLFVILFTIKIKFLIRIQSTNDEQDPKLWKVQNVNTPKRGSSKYANICTPP